MFTICVSWTLIQNPVYQRHPINVFRRQRGRRKRCTWRLASSNVDIFRTLLPPLMGYCEWRLGLPWKGYPSASQPSGSYPTLGHAYTSIVSLPSRWCGPHPSASGIPGFWHIGSACNAPSEKWRWTKHLLVGASRKSRTQRSFSPALPTNISSLTAEADSKRRKVSTSKQPAEQTQPKRA